MDRTFLPNDSYLIISFDELETAWRMLADPAKLIHIDDAIAAIRNLNHALGPQKAIYNMITATAWLVSEEPVAEKQLGSDIG